MRKITACWVLSLLTAAVACGPSQPTRSARGGKLPSGVRWAFEAGGSILARPTVAGDRLVVGSTSGTIRALGLADGAPKWAYDARTDTPEAEFRHEPLVADDLVLAVTSGKGGGQVYALEAATGQVRWKHALGQGQDGRGGSDGEVVRLGPNVHALGLDGHLVCLDLKTGEQLWQSDPVEPRIAPAAGASHLFVAFDQTRVRGLDPASGRMVWEADLQAVATTSLMARGDDLYVGTNPFRMFRLDGRTGEIASRIALQGKPVHNPVPVSGGVSVFLRSAHGEGDSAEMIVVLDEALGKLLWGRKAPQEWTSLHPQLWRDLILAGDAGGELMAYSQADGSQKWSLRFDEGLGAIGTSEESLYVGTLNGAVYALTPPAAGS